PRLRSPHQPASGVGIDGGNGHVDGDAVPLRLGEADASRFQGGGEPSGGDLRRVLRERRELAPAGRAFDEDGVAVVHLSEPVPHGDADRVQPEGVEVEGHDERCSWRRYSTTRPIWASERVWRNEGMRPRPSRIVTIR